MPSRRREVGLAARRYGLLNLLDVLKEKDDDDFLWASTSACQSILDVLLDEATTSIVSGAAVLVVTVMAVAAI